MSADDPDAIEDAIQNIGKTETQPKPPRKKPGPKPKAQKAKTKKEPVDDVPRGRTVRFDDELPPDDLSQEPLREMAEADDAAFQRRLALSGKIKAMRARFGCYGTGVEPDPNVVPEEVLERELAMHNQEINCGRGAKTIKMLTVNVLAPLIMVAADLIGPFLERRGQSKPELDHLDNIIDETWDDLYKDAADQIAIQNAGLFEAGPYSAFGQALAGSVFQTNLINKTRRKKQAEAEATAQLNQE